VGPEKIAWFCKELWLENANTIGIRDAHLMLFPARYDVCSLVLG